MLGSNIVCNHLWVAGVCATAYCGFKVLKFFAQLCNESIWSRTVNFKKYGDWVFITGGSDGIGKALAIEFAKCGMNICILSRTKSKLECVENQIRLRYKVHVKTIAVDLCDGDEIYDKIQSEIDGMQIAVLVNNVGMAWIEPTAFLDIPNFEKYSLNLANANVKALMRLTAMILPDMVSRAGGIVVNISSVIGIRSTPFLAVYGATKSLMNNFTEGLHQEYMNSGVIFQCIAPAIVATPVIAAKTKSNFMIPTPEVFGKYAIKAVGKSRYTNTGFFWHNMFQLALYLMPDAVFSSNMKKEAMTNARN